MAKQPEIRENAITDMDLLLGVCAGKCLMYRDMVAELEAA